MSDLIISQSPHIHTTMTMERSMRDVVIALVPSLIVALCYFGLGAAIVCAMSVASCVLFEWAISKYVLHASRNTIGDWSAVITGLLLGFNLPSNMPVWLVVLGALVAIGIGKMSFGGLGCNIFNPALVGRCFLLVSFPSAMTSWPVPGQLTSYVDAQTEATPLSIMKWAAKSGDASVLERLPESFSMLLGNPDNGMGAGSLGEVCAVAIVLGLVYLLWRRVITWHIPVSIIATVFVLTAALHAFDDSYVNPVASVLSGGVMLGAVFMATDYVTSPMSARGQLVYGIAIGLLTVVIRFWGAYPEGMSFAILIMNAFTPLINMYIKPRRFSSK